MCQNAHVFTLLEPALQGERAFIINAICANIGVFDFIDPNLRNDLEFMLDVVEKNGSAFQCASERLRKNFDFVLRAVREKPRVLEYVDCGIENYREIATTVVQKDFAMICYVKGEELQRELRGMRSVVSDST